MSKTRVTPELATLLARDIISSGGPTPKYRDRWSPAEAAAVEKWARTQPWWGRAMQSAESSRYVRLAIDTAQYFRSEHPADADGGPAPWPRPTFIPQEQGADPFAGASPEAARAYLAYAEVHPDYPKAMRDPKHPQHDALLAQTRALRGIAAAAPDGGDAAMGTPAAGADMPRTATERATAIYELQRNKVYLDAHHPAHAEAVAKMQALHEANTTPGAAVGGAAKVAVTPPKAAVRSTATEGPHDIIDRLQADAAYRDGRHPAHAARVAEMQRAYAAAYPAPAAGGDDAV